MYKINLLNKIATCGVDIFTEKYEIVKSFSEANGVIVRSASIHEMALPDSLYAIARAGAGVNNIPLDKCAEKGIVVFNTPGANANSVKEIVIAALLISSRDLVGGINWVSSVNQDPQVAELVEKNKAKFAGIEIKGKKLGIIGLGYTGVLVANAACRLDMEVMGFDPFISIGAAWNLSRDVKPARTLEEIYRECDFITVHVPLTEKTKAMFNKESFALMKDGVRILNFSRDTLVNDDDMIEALASGKVHRYVTDFPNPKISAVEGVIAIPHLGASTAESEDTCAMMAVEEIMDYLENGNIKHSVNYPSCDMGKCQHAGRIAINHRNVPNMLGQLTSALAQANINIADLTNKSKGQFAYTLIDIDSELPQATMEGLRKIDGVLKVRILK